MESSLSFQGNDQNLEFPCYDKDAYKVFDEMSMNKFVEKYGTVKEYFDSFNSLFSKIGFVEWYLVDLFICGLPPDIGKRVSLFQPKTLMDACFLAKLQELMHNVMIKNSNRSLFYSSKPNDSEEGVENNVGRRDLDVTWEDGVKGDEIELRVSERNRSSKSVEDSSEIQVNSNCLMILDNFECHQSKEKEFTSFSLPQPSNATPKILNHSLEGNGNPDGKTEYDFGDSTLVKREKVSEETKTSMANSQEVGIENIGVKNYEECGKENAKVKGKENVIVKVKEVKCVDLILSDESFKEDDFVNGGEMNYVFEGNIGCLADEHERNFHGNVCGYKSFNVLAYDLDVHNPSTKVVTCEDETTSGVCGRDDDNGCLDDENTTVATPGYIRKQELEEDCGLDVGESGDLVTEIRSKTFIQVTQEDKEDDVVTKDKEVMCLGILNYDVNGMKNNASTIEVSKIGVVDIHSSMFNFSKRDGNTNFNKSVEMYRGKYDDNKEEDNDLVVCDTVQLKGVYFLKKESNESTKLEGLKLDNRLLETGTSITISGSSQSTISKQSFSSVNKQNVSFKKLLADKNKNKADKDKNKPETITSGQDSNVEKTLYVNTVHVVKLPKEALVLSSTKPESNGNESFESDTSAEKLKHGMKTNDWEDSEFDADKLECKNLKVVAYASDVHSSSGKTFTYDDQWYKQEEGSEKFDIWKWPKRKKITGTKCNLKYEKWKFDIWKWPKRKRKGAKSHDCLLKQRGVQCMFNNLFPCLYVWIFISFPDFNVIA
uniref:Small GTPase superfamily, ARF/SAR type n=1 Tax=Tanacetum cinerariifolium TaxID=118510 RepID=A0A6L2L694_TANCI|nr:small GTPase superfamily, ARF/SAR type [Tanacetum cinerariifolium]